MRPASQPKLRERKSQSTQAILYSRPNSPNSKGSTVWDSLCKSSSSKHSSNSLANEMIR